MHIIKFYIINVFLNQIKLNYIDKLMKKILINITNGFSLRFLCHSEILRSLRENKELEIYILSNNAKSTKDNLGFDDVKYLEYDEKRIQKYKVSSKLYNFLETLRFLLMVANIKHQK